MSYSTIWHKLGWLRRWEGLLLGLLILTVITNSLQSEFYLGITNQVNTFQLFIEKIIVAIIMTLIIVNGEIDLSVASVMGLAAAVLAYTYNEGSSMPVAILAGLLAGVICGLINGFFVARVGLPSLVVTLAGLIMYRGVARILLEDGSIGGFPEWFERLGQDPLIGPLPLALILFVLFFAVGLVTLHYSNLGRYIYVIGNNKEVARYSGVKVNQVKLGLFVASSFIAALAGILLAARLGSVRGNTAEGFELDIITMVLLGGVSIFGGSGTLAGVGLAVLLILNLRNGMSLANITGNTQTGVVGILLILSVLVPNLAQMVQERLNRRRTAVNVALKESA